MIALSRRMPVAHPKRSVSIRALHRNEMAGCEAAVILKKNTPIEAAMELAEVTNMARMGRVTSIQLV